MRTAAITICLALAGCSAAAVPAVKVPEKGSDQAFVGAWVAVSDRAFVDRDSVFDVGKDRKRADVAVVENGARVLERIVVDCAAGSIVDITAAIGGSDGDAAAAVTSVCHGTLKKAKTVPLPAV